MRRRAAEPSLGPRGHQEACTVQAAKPLEHPRRAARSHDADLFTGLLGADPAALDRETTPAAVAARSGTSPYRAPRSTRAPGASPISGLPTEQILGRGREAEQGDGSSAGVRRPHPGRQRRDNGRPSGKSKSPTAGIRRTGAAAHSLTHPAQSAASERGGHRASRSRTPRRHLRRVPEAGRRQDGPERVARRVRQLEQPIGSNIAASRGARVPRDLPRVGAALHYERGRERAGRDREDAPGVEERPGRPGAGATARAPPVTALRSRPRAPSRSPPRDPDLELEEDVRDVVADRLGEHELPGDLRVVRPRATGRAPPARAP